MDGLIEIIFEDIPTRAVDALVRAILGNEFPREVTHTERGEIEFGEIGWDAAESAQDDQSAALFIKADHVRVGDVLISNPLLRILHYDGKHDVSIVFERSGVPETDRSGAVAKLAIGTALLADAAGVKNYFCGFEPATDETTQLFFITRLGPFSL